MDLLTATLRQMDGEKGGAKLSTVYKNQEDYQVVINPETLA
jgi:hypothetical protein